jgi:hypothetical protein
MVPALRNIAHSSTRHGPAAASLTTALRNVIPVPETSVLLGLDVHRLSSPQRSIALQIKSLFATNRFVTNVWHSSSLHCLQHCRMLSLTTQCFWNGVNTVGVACAVLPPPPRPACLFTPALQGIKLSDEDNMSAMGVKATCKYCSRLFGSYSNPYSAYILNTLIHFNFLFWVLVLQSFSSLTCDTDTKWPCPERRTGTCDYPLWCHHEK